MNFLQIQQQLLKSVPKEEDSGQAMQDSLLHEEEISAQVHKFLGHYLGRLLNEKCTAQNDEADDYA